MDARSVDPRNSLWTAEPSGYRVDFWRPLGPIPDDRGLGAPYEADERLITGAGDVTEVIDWANAKAGGRTYTLYAVHDRGDEGGLIHLFGVDPTVGP
jgi:hypothetical protein